MGDSLVLHGIGWQTYRQLRHELDANSQASARLTYSEERLELGYNRTPVQCERERLLSAIVSVIADENEMDFVGAGVTTFQCPKVKRAGEPDACFYFRDPEQKRLRNDDAKYAPDLVIDAEVKPAAVSRQGLYAAMNVTEIWHDDGLSAAILVLDTARGEYAEAPASVFFPMLDSATLTQFVENGLTLRSTVWRRGLRTWASEHPAG